MKNVGICAYNKLELSDSEEETNTIMKQGRKSRRKWKLQCLKPKIVLTCYVSDKVKASFFFTAWEEKQNKRACYSAHGHCPGY